MSTLETKQLHPLGVLSITGLIAYDPDPSEEYLNPKQKAHFEALLFRWRAHLRREACLNQPLLDPNNPADPTDRATQEEALALEVQSRDREANLIRKIDRALQRLKSDNFGYCRTCGEEIGLRRLEARPTAELCIDCKQIEERQEKSLGLL